MADLSVRRVNRLCTTEQCGGGRCDTISVDAAPAVLLMTMFFALLAAVIGLVIWRLLAATSSSDAAPHGRMSERWLAEHRATPPV